MLSSSFKRFLSDVKASNLKIQLTKAPKEKKPLEELTFGTTFSDHMLEIDWDSENGWGEPHIIPFGNMEMHPASTSLHYGLAAFEGMKGYIDAKGKARLFRPNDNFDRLNDSVARLAMPAFDAKEVEKCVEELVRVDKSWIPNKDGYSLYLRPTMISTHPILGIAPAQRAKLFVIASPVGPYYKDGFKPVKLWATDKYVRAFPGGTGNTKVGGNYGPTIIAQREAAEQGCQQVLWLYPEGGELYCTEVGAMNQFFVIKDKKTGTPTLVTAPLDGTILPGITRRSVLELCRTDPHVVSQGIKVEERHYTIDEIVEASKDGRLVEAFGCGTAAIVTPVSGIKYLDSDIEIPLAHNGVSGELTNWLYEKMLNIQYGREEHPWSKLIE